MHLLLDTHTLLWALFEPHRLALQVHEQIEDPENSVVFSAASVWEIAIKTAIRRFEVRATPAQILAAALAAGFEELPVRSSVALRVADLPMHHGDPFDRLLVAQAMSEPATLLTADAVLARYSELVSVFTPR